MDAFTIVLVVSILGLLVWLGLRTARAAKKQVAAAQSLGAELAAVLGNPGKAPAYGETERRFGDRAFRLRYSAGGKNTPASLRLTLPIEPHVTGSRGERGAYRETGRRRVAGKLSVLLRRETSLDRFGKRIGLNREHQTGDQAFDRDIYIESDASTEDLATLLEDGATRAAVQQILGAGFQSVALFAGASSLEAALSPITSASLAQMESVAGKLAQIADNLPGFDRDPVGRDASVRTAIAILAGIVSAFAFVIFAALAIGQHPLVHDGPIGKCFAIGLAGWLLVCAATFFVVRGKSDALRAFLSVFFTQVFAVPALVVGLGAGLNGWLDDGAPTVHEARVLAQWITTSKNNKTYHVRVASFHPDDPRDVELTVSSGIFMRVPVGRDVLVTTRPGWLGWEWITSVKEPPPLGPILPSRDR
jgi:hypothetical protein